MFAAMALGENIVPPSSSFGDDHPLTSTNNNNNQFGSLVAPPVKTGQESVDAFRAALQSGLDPSGTIDFSSKALADTDQDSNLQAALAAMEAEPAVPPPPVTTATTPSVLEANVPISDPRRREDVPMFAERVVLNRPLFFGPILPPRVVQEAREMVQQAQKEYWEEVHNIYPSTSADSGTDSEDQSATTLPTTPSDVKLRHLPPAVRNVVGAIRTFGFGIDVLDVHGKDFKGSAEVSTVQPVWGPEERAKHIQVRASVNRPDIVSRSVTAPAMLARPTQLNSTLSDSMKSDTNDQFTAWIQNAHTAPDKPVTAQNSNSSIDWGNDSFRQVESGTMTSIPSTMVANPQQPTEQELFSQWACGSTATAPGATLQFTTDNGGDDDSVHEDERKKQVGLSDHLSKALALLTQDDEGGPETSAITTTAAAAMPLHTSDASQTRPLSNYEKTAGKCVPVFGADDTPLPDSADLGLHETREEQAKYAELKRAQEVTAHVPPSVFGMVGCPRVISGPNDTHTWEVRGAEEPEIDQEGDGEQSPRGRKKQKQRAPRMGWWHAEASAGGKPPVKDKSIDESSTDTPERKKKAANPATAAAENAHEEPALHKPPEWKKPSNTFISRLSPTQKELLEDNWPISRLPAAVAQEQCLPYLADRPPSYKYLQVDTPAITFGGNGTPEMEPFFCSVALYHVETVSQGDAAAPVPDLQRCGRVTEALTFDVLNDASVASRCARTLYPYKQHEDFDGPRPVRNSSNGGESLQGTRCGVFPVPSNLSMANLYIVLIVRRVLSDDPNDFYYRPGKTVVDAEKLRSSAEKASQRFGALLQPLAFGVAPLLQVFGVETPLYATSRAVQIPLFRFRGDERSIRDHIMVMLYPR